MKKILSLFLVFFLIGCSKSQNNTNPADTVFLFTDALKQHDGKKVYNLISQETKVKLEEDLKGFLSTILAIKPDNKEVKKTLQLTGQDFFAQFMNLHNQIGLNTSKSTKIEITAIKLYNHNSKASVTLMANGQIKNVRLTKIKNKWFINIPSLNLLPDVK